MSTLVKFLLGFLLLLVVVVAVGGVILGVNDGLCGLKGATKCGAPSTLGGQPTCPAGKTASNFLGQCCCA